MVIKSCGNWLIEALFFVGVSLLAIGPCQSTSRVNVRPLSRASPLPQGIAV
jgi:hypothetical protein